MNEREQRQKDNLAAQAVADLRARIEVLEKIVLVGGDQVKPPGSSATTPKPAPKKDH